MSLLKKSNVNNRKSVRRNESQPSLGRMGQARSADSLEIKSHGLWASRLTFVEDFTREHSFPGLQITSTEISGSF